MTKAEIQKNQLTLIREFISICEKLHLDYVTCGKTANMVSKYDTYPTGSYVFELAIEASSMARVKQELELIPHRGVEVRSLGDYSTRECIRFVDTTTTLYDRRDSDLYSLNCIGINILPIYETAEAAKNGISQLLAQSNHNKPISSEKKSSFAGIIKRNASRSEHVSESDNQPENSIIDCYVFNDFGNLITVNPSFLANSDSVDFEGVTIKVPANLGEHLASYYGPRWKDEIKAGYRSANSMMVISDDNLSFSDYAAEMRKRNIEFESIPSRFKEYETWKKHSCDPVVEKGDYFFKAGKMTIDRIDLFLEYQAILPEIRNAHQAVSTADNQDDNSRILEELMQPYLEATARYKEKNLGFYVSEELFQYAKEIWSRQGKENYAKEVEKLIPDYYRKCDLKEYLADYIDR